MAKRKENANSQYLHRHVDNTMAYYKMPGHLVKKVRTTNRDHVSLIARKNQ